jgi:hypothetical protein
MNDSARRALPSLHEEASRYALLRRLTPTLRHHMAGEFQPIGMMAALLERRMQQASPDLASLKDNCASIGNLSRNAAETCVSLMSWVAPRTAQDVPVGQAIAECVNLLATSLRFRGFALVNQSPEIQARVSCTAVRSTLTAALLALSDAAGQPADLQVQAHDEGAQVAIELTLAPADRSADNGGSEDYRPLGWDDVQALADAEGVALARSASGVRLTLPVRSR